MSHILLTCPLYAAERAILRDAVRASGRPSASLHDFIFQTDLPGTVRSVFGVVAAYLAKSGVDTRLASFVH